MLIQDAQTPALPSLVNGESHSAIGEAPLGHTLQRTNSLLSEHVECLWFDACSNVADEMTDAEQNIEVLSEEAWLSNTNLRGARIVVSAELRDQFGSPWIPVWGNNYVFVTCADKSVVRIRSTPTTSRWCLEPSSSTSDIPLDQFESTYPWIEQVYTQCALGHVSKALRIMFWGVEDLISVRDFSSLEKLLRAVTLDRLLPEVLVGLIRSTHRARYTLPAWDSLTRSARANLRDRHVPDWERLFVGLEVTKNFG